MDALVLTREPETELAPVPLPGPSASEAIDAAARAWHGDRAATLAFLDRPHPLLAGQSPLDMARSSTAGADAVLALIRRAEAGIAL